MANEITPFERIRRVNPVGNEFWSSRDFAQVLGYTDYRNFEAVVEKARTACFNSGQRMEDHFVEITEMIAIGNGGQRAVKTVAMSRYACYLVIQNADPAKAIVALGQTYFAVQTRRQELTDEEIEAERRLMLRAEMKAHNLQLADAAKGAGVVEPRDYAIFQNHGYAGLYGGLTAQGIHNRKGLKPSQQILDHMGSTELAANLFRATQAEDKLRRERIVGRDRANRAHHEVGAKVRQTIRELGGTMPEELPVADSIRRIAPKAPKLKQLKKGEKEVNARVNSIAGRLSLRPPQRKSLEILDRLTEIVPPNKGAEIAPALDVIRSEFPTVTDFERDFPSLCFALATGVGKTRLMGAFISYLHTAHGINNFFVMAPNLTIYNKLIADFTPNTPKYVFKGIAEFATDAPEIITGDNYEAMAGTLFDQLLRCKINIFNISKINSEVRGGKSPRIKRLSEYIGESYFEYLAALPDLVLIMDESHRYRASAGVRAINELKPVLGLELTATPFVEAKVPVPFKNVIYDYPLGRAMADGFVKEPAVVTRKNFSSAGMTPEAIERMKLEDGVRLHEQVKVELETYARETGNVIVKPFVLVIARETTHAKQLIDLIQSDAFFEGRYKSKVIQVDSSKTGAEEDEMVERLLKVEHTDEPTEIVIHVNMLKEGWDVTNLYTIVPLRAAHARTLIEQSIGRGLRLPYGKRTGVTAVDRLNIIAHDRFQEIVDEAKKPDSAIRLQQVILEPEQFAAKTVTVISQSRLDAMLGVTPQTTTSSTVAGADEPRAFHSAEEERVARLVREQIALLESQPEIVPSVSYLKTPEVRRTLVDGVTAQYQATQFQLEGVIPRADIAAIVARTTDLVVQQTIDIPRITVVPRDLQSGFSPFTLALAAMNYPPVSEELWAKHLRTDQVDVIAVGKGGAEESRLEDYVVSGLIDFDDVSYDSNAALLQDLATQVVTHLRSYLPDEHEVRKVLATYQRNIAQFVHAQMQDHYWEKATGYDVRVSKGFSDLKTSAYTASASEPILDYRVPPADKSNMARYLFGGFVRCLYPVQKFQSDSERKLSVILEREATKWFKPAKGQFQIYYKSGGDHLEYQPDFVAEAGDVIYMLEPKAKNEMDDAIVLTKRDVAVTWCRQASDHAAAYKGKSWKYLLIPHDAISENMTLPGLAARFEAK